MALFALLGCWAGFTPPLWAQEQTDAEQQAEQAPPSAPPARPDTRGEYYIIVQVELTADQDNNELEELVFSVLDSLELPFDFDTAAQTTTVRRSIRVPSLPYQRPQATVDYSAPSTVPADEVPIELPAPALEQPQPEPIVIVEPQPAPESAPQLEAPRSRGDAFAEIVETIENEDVVPPLPRARIPATRDYIAPVELPAVSASSGGEIVRATPPQPAQAPQTASTRGANSSGRFGAFPADVNRRLERIEQNQRTPAVDPGCPQRLANMGVNFTIVPPEVRGQCVVVGAVVVESFPGVSLAPTGSEMTCDMAERTARWLAQSVRPRAVEIMGQPITQLRHFSAYSCRTRGGGKISEHGFANALDVAVFELADGERITVEDNWRGDGTAFGARASSFLRNVGRDACNHFQLILTPDSDADHYNHFHFDAGPWHSCG